MRFNPLLLLIIGLASLSVSGCFQDEGVTGLDSGSGAQTDDEAIRALMNDGDDYFGSGAAMGEEPVTVEGTEGKSSPSGAPIQSFYFIRRITQRDIHRDIHIENPQEGPSIATVSTLEDLRGIFRLFVHDPNRIYLPRIIDKPLVAQARYNAMFARRHRPENDRWRGWRLIKVSGAEIASVPTTKEIVSLEISSPSVNRVITDPLELVPVSELPTFQPGERVTLRVTTTDENDFVFLHVGGLKDEFHPVGGGVFEGTWTVGDRIGRRRVAVDVIDRETLFDDEAPYDSMIWAFHFRVRGEGDPDFAAN